MAEGRFRKAHSGPSNDEHAASLIEAGKRACKSDRVGREKERKLNENADTPLQASRAIRHTTACDIPVEAEASVWICCRDPRPSI